MIQHIRRFVILLSHTCLLERPSYSVWNCSQLQGGLYIADLCSTSIPSQESMMCSKFPSTYPLVKSIWKTSHSLANVYAPPFQVLINGVLLNWSVPKVCIACAGVVVFRVVGLYRASSTISSERSAIRYLFKMNMTVHIWGIINNRTDLSSVSGNTLL